MLEAPTASVLVTARRSTSTLLFASLLVTLLGPAPASWGQPPSWAELPPPPLAGGTMVYDVARNRILLVGGSADVNGAGTIWTVVPGASPVWTELQIQGTPPPIQRNSVFYDPERDRLVSFLTTQGVGLPAKVTVLRFDMVSPKWEALVTTGTGPAAIGGCSVIYDPPRDRMIVFGGRMPGLGSLTNEVHALTFAGSPTWSLLAPSGTLPVARANHSATYDPTGDRMVVFGGIYRSGFNYPVLNESWALSLNGASAWTFLTPTGPVPTARTSHPATLDAVGQRLIVFGGTDQYSTSYFADTWALSLTAGNVATWTALPSGPPGRSDSMLGYEPSNTRVVLYGGVGASGRRTDLWTLPLAGTPTWSLHGLPDPPPLLSAHAAALDRVRDRAFVFGEVSETWARSLTSQNGWTPVAGFPTPRHGAVAVNDPLGDRALLFGGAGASVVYDDTQGLDFATFQWSPLGQPNDPRPPVRFEGFAAFDPSRRHMLIYGGQYVHQTPFKLLNRDDTWSFDAASETWSQLAVGSFGQRSNLTGIYDPVRDRLVAFGGADTTALYNDVHILPLGPGGSWSLLATQGTPPPLNDATILGEAIYDPVADRMLLFAPDVGLEVWGLSLSAPATWTKLTPSGRLPILRGRPSVVADYGRGRAIVYGGSNLYSSVSNETWAFTFNQALVDVGAPSRDTPFRLSIARNPVRGPLDVSFALESAGPAKLELLDVQGRRVLVRDPVGTGSGPQRVRIEDARGLPTGIYLVRLTQGSRRAHAKAVIIE